MTAILGIHGKKGSGKNTVANIVLEGMTDPKLVAVAAYATRLKDLCFLIFNVPYPHFEDHTLKDVPLPGNKGKTPRQMMTTVADLMKEFCGQDYFVDVVRHRYERVKEDGLLFIVTDVRFENEASWIREEGGMILHVQRPSLGLSDEHNSEKGILLRMHDRVVVNDGSMDSLRGNVLDFMTEWIGPDFGPI